VYGVVADLLEGFETEGFAVGCFDVGFGEGDGEGGGEAGYGEGGMLGGGDLVVVVVSFDDGVADFLAIGEEGVVFDGAVGSIWGGIGGVGGAVAEGEGGEEEGEGV